VLEALERAEELGVEVGLPRSFAEEGAKGAAAPQVSWANTIELKEYVDGNGAGNDAAAPGRLACHLPILALYDLTEGGGCPSPTAPSMW